jgi:hypothetical protein
VSKVIVDTGPLIAFLVETDLNHTWATEGFRALHAPFLTCEPVLTETSYLVARLHNGPRRFFELLDSGLLNVEFNVLSQRGGVAKTHSKICRPANVTGRRASGSNDGTKRRRSSLHHRQPFSNLPQESPTNDSTDRAGMT